MSSAVVAILGFLKGFKEPNLNWQDVLVFLKKKKKKKKDFARVFLPPKAADQHFPFLTQGSQECLLQGGEEAGNTLRKDFVVLFSR